MIRGAMTALLLLPLAAVAGGVTLDGARAQFEAMRSDEAQRQFEQLQAQRPDDPAVLYYLGKLQLRQHHRQPAVDLLRRAVALAPTNTEYRLSLCEAIGALIDDQPFYRQLGLAREIHGQLQIALAGDPEAVAVHDGLLHFYLEAPALIGGGHDKAEQAARKIASLDPVAGHIAVGTIAEHDQRWADAEREYRAAVQAAPGQTAPRYALGNAQVQQQRYDEALLTYQRLQKDFPKETAVYYGMAALDAAAGQHLERGIAAVQTYLAQGPRSDLDPSAVQAYRLLGRLSELSARREEARKAYRLAQQLDPVDTAAARALSKLD